jgi:glycosyltransferase involved in cell wall biosynthesis
MKILFFIDGHNGCSWYRALVPGRYLVQEGGHQVMATTSLDDDIVREVEVVVFQKRFFKNDVVWMRKCLKLGKRVIFEFDDDYFSLPSWNGTGHLFKPVKTSFISALRTAPKITVTTERLKTVYQGMTKEITVLPNSIDLVRLKESLETYPIKPRIINHVDQVDLKTLDGFRIGWAGSATHKKDLEVVQDVLIRLARRYPSVRIFMLGAASDDIIHKIPRKQLFLIEGVPVDWYLPILSCLGLHVGLAPLVNIDFNLSKSNLKLLEYMSVGAVPLASPVGEYFRTLEEGKDIGFLCSSHQDWELRLIQLMMNQGLREEMKVNGRKFVEEQYDVAKNWVLWEQAYFA